MKERNVIIVKEAKIKDEKLEETKKDQKEVSDHFTKCIKEYLDNQSAVDPLFKSKYENPKKSISECCGYIVEEVRKMNVKGLSDDEVYYMARHYYEEEDLKGKPYSSKNVVINHNIVLTEEEKEEQKKKALENYKNQCIEELKKEEQRKKEAKEKVLAKIKKKEEETGQLSLF